MSAVAPATRVQVPLAGANVPVLFVVKPALPVGVVGDEEVSVTVAVHVVGVLTWTDPGEHVTAIVVECGGAVTTARL